MSRKEWFVAVVAIGVGIVLQIPRHDAAMDASGHAAMEAPGSTAMEPSMPASRTVALEVTGMT